jgi:hypothetical protein
VAIAETISLASRADRSDESVTAEQTAAKEITKMTTFIINAENNIAALTAAEVAGGLPEGATAFASEKELHASGAGWPRQPPGRIWNGIPA